MGVSHLKFDQWQFSLIREALRQHLATGQDVDGKGFTLHSLAADISADWENKEGVFIDAKGEEQSIMHQEALSRFCRGDSPLGDERREAVYRYVTDPSRNLLSKRELEEPENFDYLIALRFLGFLESDQNKDRAQLPKALTGAYSKSISKENIKKRLELTFEEPIEGGMAKVSYAIKHTYGVGMPAAEGKNKPDRFSRFFGWAILTPEKYLIAVLKNNRNGDNLFLMALTSDLRDTGSRSPTYLAFYNHTSPVIQKDRVLKTGEAIPSQGFDLNDNLIIFTRAE